MLQKKRVSSFLIGSLRGDNANISNNFLIGRKQGVSNLLIGALRDSDKDKVPNWIDCQPNNKNQHGIFKNIKQKIQERKSKKDATTLGSAIIKPDEVQEFVDAGYKGASYEVAGGDVTIQHDTQGNVIVTATTSSSPSSSLVPSGDIEKTIDNTKRKFGGSSGGGNLGVTGTDTTTNTTINGVNVKANKSGSVTVGDGRQAHT